MRTASPSAPQLVEALFGAYRKQILALLLLRPDETFYVREISRLTGVPTGSLHRELKALTKTGLLTRTTAGNQVRYQASRDFPIYEELAGIFRKTAGLADVLRDLLSPVQDEVSLALIFGSMAQGKPRATSDVDLLVLGSVDFASVVEACHAGTRRLGRDVNPVVMTRESFQNKYRKGDRFVSRIVSEPKIFVIGDASELGKLLSRSEATDRRRSRVAGRQAPETCTDDETLAPATGAAGGETRKLPPLWRKKASRESPSTAAR